MDPEEILKPENSGNDELPVSKPSPRPKSEMIIFNIEVEKIRPNPHQPRTDFNEEALKGLAGSIREFGVLQPLVVSRIETENEDGTTSVGYELIAGERRLRAAEMVGLPTVPVIIRQIDLERHKLELAIIENIQRADLNPIEAARAFSRLQDEFRLTQREIAARLGKSREVVANTLRLLNLPSEIQQAVSEGRLNESQARMLLAVAEIPVQIALFEDILRNNLSVREIRNRVRNIDVPVVIEGAPAPIDAEAELAKERLEEALGTKVDVRKDGESGKIIINFYSQEELMSILDRFLKENGNRSPSLPEEFSV